MKRHVGIFLAAIATLALASQTADAGSRRHHRHHHVDHRIKATAAVVGVASTLGFLSLNNWRFNGSWDSPRANGLTTGGAYAVATIGCMAISPMVATAVVRRPLTHREAHVLFGSCVVPIIGGWLVNAAYNAHPEWDRFDASR